MVLKLAPKLSMMGTPVYEAAKDRSLICLTKKQFSWIERQSSFHLTG